ncbi:hypothetical protein Tco_1540331 [Tanacetum coccineum]
MARTTIALGLYFQKKAFNLGVLQCRALINQGNRNGDAGYTEQGQHQKRPVPVETSDAIGCSGQCFDIPRWTWVLSDGVNIAQDEPTEFALIAYTSNSSGSDIEKNEVVYEEKIAVLEFEVKDKRLDDSVYRPTTNKTSVSVSQVETNVAKQSSFRAAISTGAVKQVKTATHTNRVNVSQLRTNAFHKSNSPIKRPFYKSTTPNIRILNVKVNSVRVNGVNTVGQTTISVVKGNRVTTVKALAGCVWRPKMIGLNNGNPQQALKNKGIFDSGCFRHMTRNKDFLIDYQDIDGLFVVFGGSALDPKSDVGLWIQFYADKDSSDYTQVLFGLKLEGKHDDQLLNTAGLSFLFLKKLCTAEPLPTETPSPIFHEPQPEAHIEQLLPSPTTYQRKRKTQTRRRTKKDTKLPQTSVPQDLEADEAVHKEGVTGIDTCGSPRRQDTMRVAPAQTRSKKVLEQPIEPPLSKGHTSGSGEGMDIQEKDKKKAKTKQNRARNEKDKVKSRPNDENTT